MTLLISLNTMLKVSGDQKVNLNLYQCYYIILKLLDLTRFFKDKFECKFPKRRARMLEVGSKYSTVLEATIWKKYKVATVKVKKE